MRRGISPVITSTLLVLVSIAVVAIFYTWATASTTQVAGAIYTDAQTVQRQILADVDIITPPPVNSYDTNQPVIIHNTGSIPLAKLTVSYIKPEETTTNLPEGELIDVDGGTTHVGKTDWPIDQLNPGESLIIWLPADNYSGYTIIVIAQNFSTSKTIGAP